MRQIFCSDKECQLLPSTQSGSGIQGEHILSTSTGGLIPEANSASLSFSSAKTRVTKRRTKQRGSRRKITQSGGRRKITQRGGRKKITQRGGSRKIVKKIKRAQAGGRRVGRPCK